MHTLIDTWKFIYASSSNFFILKYYAQVEEYFSFIFINIIKEGP